jgi:hypothetical protein
MSLALPRRVPEPEAPRRHDEKPKAARIAALAEHPFLPWWRQRLHGLLDICWIGSLAIVSLLTVTGVSTALLAPLAHASWNNVYNIGEIVDFRRGGDAVRFIREGWAKPTEDGTRTSGVVADLAFSTRLPPGAEVWLHLSGSPEYAPQDDAFWMDLLMNGTRIAQFQYRRSKANYILDAKLPNVATRNNAPFHLTFIVGAAHAKPGPTPPSGYRIESLVLLQR